MPHLIFRNRRTRDLMCAVSAGRDAPPFVLTPAWEFAGVLTPDKPRPDGFNEDAARYGCATQGFYAWRARSARDRKMMLAR